MYIERFTKISNYIIHNIQKFVYKYFVNKKGNFCTLFHYNYSYSAKFRHSDLFSVCSTVSPLFIFSMM